MVCWKVINAKGEKIKQESNRKCCQEGVNTSYTVAREGLTETGACEQVLKIKIMGEIIK